MTFEVEPRFKVGDQVRIVKIQGHRDQDAASISQQAAETLTTLLEAGLQEAGLSLGDVVTVTEIFLDGYLVIDDRVHIPQDCLELVEQVQEESFADLLADNL